ncbi:MAG: STAS domain-containing protein [Myxococcaceae bacterium]
MPKLKWQLQPQADETRVVFSGDLIEGPNLDELVTQIHSNVVFDLAEVGRVSSSGVRQWIQMMNALTAAGHHIAFDRCSPAIVSQFNMVAQFRGAAEIRSILAPYYCQDCNKEHPRQIVPGPNAATELEEKLPCPSCGTNMEFDELVESFLGFRSHDARA